jgi:hypothetical protein
MIDKDTLLQWLRDEGALYRDDNIYYADKAFIANSIVQWCAKRSASKNISNAELDKYFHSLRLFLQNKIDIYWDDDIINVKVRKDKR